MEPKTLEQQMIELQDEIQLMASWVGDAVMMPRNSQRAGTSVS
jgi:hypothetical protein